LHFEGNERGKNVELIQGNVEKNNNKPPFFSFHQLKSTRKERREERQGAMELIAERN